jgi:hypothetical protein
MKKSTLVTLASASALIGADALAWIATGAAILSKSAVPVEVRDEMLDTTRIEWKAQMVFGLDLAAPIGVAIMVAALVTVWIIRRSRRA